MIVGLRKTILLMEMPAAADLTKDSHSSRSFIVPWESFTFPFNLAKYSILWRLFMLIGDGHMKCVTVLAGALLGLVEETAVFGVCP